MVLLLLGAVAIQAKVPAPGAPVSPDHLTEPDSVLTVLERRGQYLATAGNCISCHTVPGGKPFAGGVSFPTDFGTIFSTNITPDARTGIGAWTLADFRRALHEGVRPDGKNLYPAFPYTAFTRLRDDDIEALFAYIKTLTPVFAPARPNTLRFPYSQRAFLTIWKMLFFTEGRFQPRSSQSAQVNRGEYLVEALGHCSACHSPRNFLGAERQDLRLTGGTLFDQAGDGGGTVVKWAATNITPHASGIGAWDAQAIADYLKHGSNQHAVLFGPMNEVVINSTSNLTDADRIAMALYLKQVPARQQQAARPASQPLLVEGEENYGLFCGTCHLPSGKGDKSLGVPLVGSAVAQAPHPASLINIILYGPKLPSHPKFSTSRRLMSSFEGDMSNQEVASVASYVRAMWGNEAGGVTAADVAAQRE